MEREDHEVEREDIEKWKIDFIALNQMFLENWHFVCVRTFDRYFEHY